MQEFFQVVFNSVQTCTEYFVTMSASVNLWRRIRILAVKLYTIYAGNTAYPQCPR